MSTSIVSSFIEGSPPGELNEVINSIKALTADSDPSILQKCKSAFQKYNESQLVVGKVPGGTSYVRTACIAFNTPDSTCCIFAECDEA